MNVELFTNFSKRINSTKRPAGGETRDVKLKDATSIERPVFLLRGALPNYNYLKFDDRYYYIDDITSVAYELYELSCSIDYLATYKSEIGSYNCFVERSSANYNIYINDGAVSAEQRLISENIATTSATSYDTTGCYIVRVVGADSADGGVATYAMDVGGLQSLLTYCFDENNFTDEIVDQFIKTFFNPFQYIVSVMWFPIALASISGSPSSIKLGWWEVSGSFTKIGSSGISEIVQLKTPSNYYADYRAYHPNYTQVTLQIPGTGAINLDPTLLSEGQIWCETVVDYITGDANTSIAKWVNGVRRGTVATIAGKWGVPVTIGQLQSIVGGIVQTGASMLTGLSGASNPISAIGGVIEGVQNILSPTPSVLGGAGNKQSLKVKSSYSVSIRNYGSGEIPTSVYGRPCCRNLTISSIPGYIKCANASVPIPSLGKDRDIVNAYLNGGFYYE